MDVTVVQALDANDRHAISTLLDRATAADGHHPLSDEAWLEFNDDTTHQAKDGSPAGFAAILATEPNHDHLAGYGQISRVPGDGSWTLHTVLDPHHRFGATDDICSVIEAALAFVDANGGGDVQYWVSHPTAAHDDLAARYGFGRGRDLLQLRVDLPLAERTDITTRSFIVGEDEAAWVEVNNRAFDWHPEQGGWTIEAVRRRETEPWFDATGFLLHDRDDRLAGFCWTKIHTQPFAMGEIYVIAVDPDFGGHGLGRHLTIAGLQSLADRGVTTGMLFVDSENAAARRLYDKLGFRTNHVNRAYRTTRPAAAH